MPHGRTLFKMVAGQVIGVGGLFFLVKTITGGGSF